MALAVGIVVAAESPTTFRGEARQAMVPPMYFFLVLHSTPTLETFQPMKGEILAGSPDILNWNGKNVLVGPHERLERADKAWSLTYDGFPKRKISLIGLPSDSDELRSFRQRAHVGSMTPP